MTIEGLGVVFGVEPMRLLVLPLRDELSVTLSETEAGREEVRCMTLSLAGLNLGFGSSKPKSRLGVVEEK